MEESIFKYSEIRMYFMSVSVDAAKFKRQRLMGFGGQKVNVNTGCDSVTVTPFKM